MEMLPKVGDWIQCAGIVHAIREDESCWMTMIGEACGEVTSVRPTGFVELQCSKFGKCRVHKTAIVEISELIHPEFTWDDTAKPADLL